ncbi:hypothetical protein LIER_26915 [Lithospermum erythrorhizon]|uniref:Uncharacterized protein n=1 Tax=Lithospermum erythrorhizon TaxID=34254 RepID=A0AAV3RAC4_LITER
MGGKLLDGDNMTHNHKNDSYVLHKQRNGMLYSIKGVHSRSFFCQIDYKNLLPKLVRMRSAPGRYDRDRYCEYHREHGNDTNECRILKAEIEKLIKQGHLKEFIERENLRDTPRQNHRSPPRDNCP